METLNYIKSGNGDTTALLLHGFASSARMWDTIIEHSDMDATWWAVDLPGFGETPAPEGIITIDEHVAAVIRFVEAHNLKPNLVMAHSTGGAIALKLAITRPDLVEKMVVISPVVTGEFTSGGVFSKIVRSQLGTALLRSTPALLEILQKSRIAERFTSLAGIGVDNMEVKQQMITDFHAMNPVSSIETMISLAQHNMTQFLTEIQQPILVIVGDKDLTVPCSEGKLAAQYMPHAEIKIFAGAYHHPHEEQPVEFAAAVRDFLIAQNGTS